MSARVITLLWILCAALGVLSGDSRASIATSIGHQPGLTTIAAHVAHAHSAMHAGGIVPGDFSTNDFVQRYRTDAHARTHPGFAKRWILADADRAFVGRALEFAHIQPAPSLRRPPLAANQARAPPV